ncbi:cysteine--tRNA ligase, chloroplastic/mitochondrial isoform X3 [Tanacetum coccineum]
MSMEDFTAGINRSGPSTSKRRRVHSHEHGHASFKDRLSAQDRKDALRDNGHKIQSFQGKKQGMRIQSLAALKKTIRNVLDVLGLMLASYHEVLHELREKALKRAKLSEDQVIEKINERNAALYVANELLTFLLHCNKTLYAGRVCQWKCIVARAYTSPQTAPLCHLSQLSQPAVGALNNPKGTCNQAKSRIRVAIQHEKKRKSSVLRWRMLKKG